MSSGFLNLLSEVIVGIQVENIRHQVQRILIILNLCVQARQVEAVRKVFLVDLAKVFISSRRDKLAPRARQ